MLSVLRWVALLVAVAFLVGGCASGASNDIKTALGQEFTLPVGKTAVINGEALKISFQSVTADSRCPTGVECIRAGEAICQMKITHEGSTTDVVFTADGGIDGYSESKFGDYTAHFRREPYPEAEKQIGHGDYRLILSITKLSPKSG